jgi:hypothetical protein
MFISRRCAASSRRTLAALQRLLDHAAHHPGRVILDPRVVNLIA